MDEQKRLLDTDAFLGRGWSFPPTLTDGGVAMAAYEEDIEQSLCVLFSTSPGERVCHYDYGCPLPPAPLRLRADNYGNHRAYAERHRPCSDSL